jgi:protein-L-isoaspartate(D-aspartate) O-methyltransferase
MTAYLSSLWQIISFLEKKGILCSSGIKDALIKVDRRKFIPSAYREYAYSDEALPIGFEQTISQPSTVVFMLELLNVGSGQKVLDIGAGSGWVRCLLAELVGEQGHVYAFEINEKIGKIGLRNINKFGKNRVMYRIIDAAKYWDAYALYDRIHVAAAFEKIPEKLLSQLKIKGILVAPTQDGNLWKITKTKEGEYKKEKFYGFSFVPFVEEEKG